MRISSSVGPAIVTGATTDFVLRAALFVGPGFFVLADGRGDLTLSILFSGNDDGSKAAGFSMGTVLDFLGTDLMDLNR